MRKKLFVVMLLSCFCCIGCEYVTGFGAGAAGQETLQSWKANLEEQKAALEERYKAAFAELESAPDPNTVALAKQKLEEVQRAQIGNSAALLTVETILKLPEAESGEGGKTDVLISSLIGAGIIALREWQKRKLGKKYISMKAGKAVFEAAEPAAGKKLHTAIGIERTNRGL